MASILGAERADPDVLTQRVIDLVKSEQAPPPDTERTRLTFSAVAAEVDYDIFFAEAEEVGYKRRKQGGDLVRPNDLFRVDENGKIVVDTAAPTTVLDRFLAPSLSRQEPNGFRSRFARIGNESALRCDAKYRWFRDVESSKVVPNSAYPFVPLWRFLRLAPKRVVKKGELEEERKLVELEMVESGTGHLLGFEVVDEVGSDKLEFGDSHIVFSKLEPYLAKAILNDPTQEFIGSTEWLTLYVNEDEAVREYMWAFLLSPAARRAFRSLQSGKRHARIHVADFFSILIPCVPRDGQRDAVASLNPCWDQIREMRRQLKVNQLAAESEFEKSLRG
jgi:type I restriction enzyme M protein